MRIRVLDPNALGHDEDWEGNNAAFRCPVCAKVFIVNSTRMHGGDTGSAQSAGNPVGE